MIARISVALSLLALVGVGPAAAQDESSLVQVVTVTVKPGTNAQFEEFVRGFREASRKQNLKNYWLASQSVSGEQIYTFTIARGGYADLADPGPQLVKALGEAEAKRLGALSQASIESVRTAFYRTRADRSVPPAAGSPAPAAVAYYHITLKPGMAAQFAEASRQTRIASLAVTPNSHYLTQTPEFGATGIRVVGLIQSWGDLDRGVPGPQQRNLKHYGPEKGAKINSMAADAIANIDVVLNRTRPDLNYDED